MWDFAAYVMSEDQNVANNVAHTYLALTQGDASYIDCLIVYTVSGWHSSSDVSFYNIGIRCPKEPAAVCISEEFDKLPVQIGCGFRTADDVFDFIEAAGGFPTEIEPEQMADIEDIFREG